VSTNGWTLAGFRTHQGVSLAFAEAEPVRADVHATPGSASVQVIHTTDLRDEERKPAPPVVIVLRAALNP
jgi:hypothetical protein